MAAPARLLFASRTTSQICSGYFSTASRPRYSQHVLSRASISSSAASVRIPSIISRRTFSSTPRALASSPTAAEAMERIEQLYENATEEFQMAAEETEGNTVYAADDREAAKAEVEKLEGFFKEVTEGTGYDQDVREEVKRRAGGRIRELANAMTALEEKAMEHD